MLQLSRDDSCVDSQRRQSEDLTLDFVVVVRRVADWIFAKTLPRKSPGQRNQTNKGKHTFELVDSSLASSSTPVWSQSWVRVSFVVFRLYLRQYMFQEL